MQNTADYDSLPLQYMCASTADYSTLLLQYMCKYCRLQHFPLAVYVQILLTVTVFPCNARANTADFDNVPLQYMYKCWKLQHSPISVQVQALQPWVSLCKIYVSTADWKSPLAIHEQILQPTTVSPCNTCAHTAAYNSLPLQYMCKYCSKYDSLPLQYMCKYYRLWWSPLVICTYYQPSVNFCHKHDAMRPGEWSHLQLEKHYHHGCWLILFDHSLVGTS